MRLINAATSHCYEPNHLSCWINKNGWFDDALLSAILLNIIAGNSSRVENKYFYIHTYGNVNVYVFAVPMIVVLKYGFIMMKKITKHLQLHMMRMEILVGPSISSLFIFLFNNEYIKWYFICCNIRKKCSIYDDNMIQLFYIFS